MKRILIFLSLIFFLCLSVIACHYPQTKYSINFIKQPCIKPHSQYNYLTCHPIDVVINSRKITIPKGFDTDLASIPRWYWLILSPSYSNFIAPSILHDYLYGCSNNFSRKNIDEIFYSALRKNGVSKYTSYKMFLAVRLFGESHFSNAQCFGNEYIENLTDYTFDECATDE